MVLDKQSDKRCTRAKRGERWNERLSRRRKGRKAWEVEGGRDQVCLWAERRIYKRAKRGDCASLLYSHLRV